MTRVRDTEGLGEADATLRLIASLPAPEELAERVRGRLQAGSGAGSVSALGSGRVLAWRDRVNGARDWMRGAAAAAIVGVVSGGAWWIYASVAPSGAGSAVAPPVHVRQAGGFSNAGAMHMPETLKGPVLREGTATPTSKERSPKTPPATKGPKDQGTRDAEQPKDGAQPQ